MTTPAAVHPGLDMSLDDVLAAAAAAEAPLADTSADQRARLLRLIADAFDAAAGELTALASKETQLGEARLTGEIARTTGQLRAFADSLTDGYWADAVIDTGDPSAKPPRPDLRRMLVPVGPVLVFAASNFPFAFSVAGGDTAAALAAGGPVILKAHPGHPETSRASAELVRQAVADAELPDGAFQLIEGQENGVVALKDQRVRAASFTGSVAGGRALFDIANQRETPIPFYAEMGSLNPVVVTPLAVERRGAQIVSGFVDSFTLGVGQFCTKPGLVFLPRGHGLESQLSAAVEAIEPGQMLTESIQAHHHRMRERLAALSDVSDLASAEHGANPEGDGVVPRLLSTTVEAVKDNADDFLVECFGPTAVVIEYDDVSDVLDLLPSLPGNLTATVHAEEDDPHASTLLRALRDNAGRLVWNGWPTGVSVSAAQHHGGPYPATSNAAYTSVGLPALRRFQRPVAYQNCPDSLLPQALQDHNTLGLARLLDGERTTADVQHRKT
jgi:NADP-dependent aldehyde dehydrogenase